MPHTNNKEVEEKFKKQFCKPRLTPLEGEIPMLFSVTQAQDIIDFLHQELQKARESERERIEDAFAKVADYTEDLSADAYGEPINTSFYRLYEGQWEQIIKPKDHSELDQPNNK